MYKSIKFTSAFFFFLAFIYLFLVSEPKYFAAGFSDSVSVNAGIKLTLGNLQMTESTSYLNSQVTVNSASLEQNLLTTTLTNKGTLTGKLGYKIESDIPSDLRDTFTFSLYEGDNYLADLEQSGNYLFLNQNAEAISIEPGSQKNYSIRIKTDVLPVETQHFQIAVSFILSQTNATEPQQMFYDEVIFDPIAITVEKTITDPTIEWPPESDNRWQTDSATGVRYINEFDTEIMYFSETSGGDRIQNLDDVSIYIDYSSNDGQLLNGLSSIKAPFTAATEEVAEGKIRIDISIDAASNGQQDTTTLISDWFRIVLVDTGYRQNLIFDGTLNAKRLLLTTDNADHYNNGTYQNDLFPIYVSNSPQDFRLAYIKNNNYGELATLTEAEINLDQYAIEFVANKTNTLLTGVNVDNNAFTLQLSESLTRPENAKELSILMTGDSGSKLKIIRSIKAIKSENLQNIPTDWYVLGNGISVSSLDLLYLNLQNRAGNKVESDDSNPPTLYFKNEGAHYFGFNFQNNVSRLNGLEITDITYSADLRIMKVTFSFKANNSSFDGFNYMIDNGLHMIANKYIKYNYNYNLSQPQPVLSLTSMNSENIRDSGEQTSLSTQAIDSLSEPPATESDAAAPETESPQPTTP